MTTRKVNLPHGLKPPFPDEPGIRPGRLLFAVAFTGLALALASTSVHAQENAPLRGNVDEDVLGATRSTDPLLRLQNAQITAEQENTGIPSPPYQPASPGALPEEANTPADQAGSTLLPGISSTGQAADRDGEARTARTDPETTGSIEQPWGQRALTVDSLEEMNERAEREQPVEGPIESRYVATEEDPFAPTGIRLGTFTLRPSIEQGFRASSNVQSSSSGSSGVLSETTLRLNGATDWSRHAAFLDAYGRYAKSISGEDYTDPNVGIRAGLRLDLANEAEVTGEIGYLLRQESASDPTFITGTVDRPNVHTFDARLGATRDIGRFFAGIEADIRRTIYDDAKLMDGTTVSQKDRNATFASMALRGGFEMSPALRPFVEVEFGRLVYDETFDINGYERSGTRLGLRGGVELDITEKLNGEFAIGYVDQAIDDARLDSVGGLSVDAALDWSPVRGTDVRLDASTNVEGATAPGDSGSILYLANIGVTRQIRSDLSVNAAIGGSVRDNRDGTGTDLGFRAEAGATYWFNRFVGLNGSVRHELVKSDVASREYDASSVYLGMTLRR
ncbi:MAG: outer membrane beta-barrel protein [Phyllobacterium sp.]